MADEPSQPFAPKQLKGLFQLDKCEGWELLRRHLELAEGFSFGVITAPDDWGVAYLREEFPSLLPSPDAWEHLVFDPSAPPECLAETLLDLPAPGPKIAALWLDAEPGLPESLPHRDEAWGQALARLNRYRNTLSSRLTCALLLAIPVRLLPILRASAPDLWAIRSGLFRVEPPGVTRTSLERMEPRELELPEVGGDYRQTLTEAKKLRGKSGQELLLAELLHRAGRQAHEALQWREAEKALQEAYEIVQHHGADPEQRVKLSLALGDLFQDEANFGRSEFYKRRALTDAEQHFGQNHPVTSIALNNLAQLLKATNRLAEAKPLMRRALEIAEASFGPSHPKVAIRLSNLASLLQDTSRLAEAEPLIRRALEIDEANFGPSHPNVAIRLNNLASLLQDTNRLAEAEPLMRRALEIDEVNFGSSHPEVSKHLNNLASLLRDTHRLREAEPLVRRALQIDMASFGTMHPKVAADLNNLAQLLKATNRLGEAEPLMRQALEIDQESFGPSHPIVAIRLNNLAGLLKATTRLEAAEPLLRRAALILLQFTTATGHVHPASGAVVGNCLRLWLEMGVPEEELQSRVVALFQEAGISGEQGKAIVDHVFDSE